ncbi:MAG: hypothetical protein IJ367_00690, partial [Clostridia bacterium]|nr:hypothetical protein [Clostridia bacterium]
MNQSGKLTTGRAIVLYTAIATVLLVSVISTMVSYMFRHTEAHAFENLQMQAESIKNDIDLQMLSDRENLVTMASVASKLYKDGESFELLFRSFEEIGLLENVGILCSDGTFLTKKGNVNIGNTLNFAEEAQKGEYISGRVKDITADLEVVRSAVPIKVSGETIAMLYGVVNLSDLEERYGAEAKKYNAELLVIESGTGNYIIDTRSDT